MNLTVSFTDVTLVNRTTERGKKENRRNPLKGTDQDEDDFEETGRSLGLVAGAK